MKCFLAGCLRCAVAYALFFLLFLLAVLPAVGHASTAELVTLAAILAAVCCFRVLLPEKR